MQVVGASQGEVLLVSDHAKMALILKSSLSVSRAVHEVAAVESLLLQLPLFRGANLSAPSLLLLRDLVSYTAYEKAVPVELDQYNESFMIVIRGNLQVQAAYVDTITSEQADTGGFIHRKDLKKVNVGPGQFFGGSSLFIDARPQPGREVYVVSTDKSLIAYVSHNNFARLIEMDAYIEQVLTTEAKRRLLHSFRSSRMPFFADLDDSKLQNIATASRLLPVEPEQPINVMADPGLYLVADGEVSILPQLHRNCTPCSFAPAPTPFSVPAPCLGFSF